MRRIIAWIFIGLLVLGLSGCGAATAGPEASSAPLPGVAGPLPEADPGWAEEYAAFVEKNYAALSESCYGAVAGVGFLDLDLDGTPEPGAVRLRGLRVHGGAAVRHCGRGGHVRIRQLCGRGAVSAGSTSPLYVDTVYFEDFRFLQAEDGRRWFQVLSRNGAENFYYNELIRFSSQDGVLTLESVYYKRVVTDRSRERRCPPPTRWGAPSADEAAFAQAEKAALAAGEDSGYEAVGAFLWSDKTFGDGYNGLMRMIQAAVAGYAPIE